MDMLDELFCEFKSGLVLTIVAVLVMTVPAVLAPTVTTMRKTVLEPFASDPIVHVPVEVA